MRSSQYKNEKKKRKFFPTKTSYKILIILMMLVGTGFLVMLALVDAFPANMVIGFLITLIVMLLLADLLLCRDVKWQRIVGVVIAALFVIIYGLGIYYLTTTYTMFERITTEDEAASSLAKSVDVTEDPFNVYITGIDQWNDEKGYDLERSDVNMIVTVSPQTRQVILTSIPRDAYVPLHRTGTMDKLTHTGIYGVDETLNTIKDWTGLDMNYYVKVNFDACVDVVDAIGGIDIYNPKEFYGSLNNHHYEKGKLHLMGRGALYYARERKAYGSEDQLRVKNQLKVVKAMLKKMMSSKTLLTKYGAILDAISGEMETNMPESDIRDLVRMQLTDLATWDIQTQRMSGDYDMEVVASMDSSNEYQVLKVSKKTFRSCIKRIDKTMHPTAVEIAEATAARQKNSIMSFIKQFKK